MNKGNTGVHWSFWLISVIALIWNVLGVVNFFVQMNPQVLAAYRASEQAIILGRPLWATAGFAIAVFGGALGCFVLLWRRSFAFYLFVASLVGVMVTMTHALTTGVEFGTGEILGIIILPPAIAAFLIWYSQQAIRRGWVK